MINDKLSSTKIALAVVFLVVLGTIAYFVMPKNSSPGIVQPTPSPTITPTVTPTPISQQDIEKQKLQNSKIASIIKDLQSEFVQYGYKINNNVSDDMWWLGANNATAYIHTVNALTFIITTTAQEDYTTEVMDNGPEIAKVVGQINDYMNLNNFNLQQAQSTSDANPHITGLTYTKAYYDSQNDLRCRLAIKNPYSGVGGKSPYTFTATIMCINSLQFEEAYNEQAPFLLALTKELNPNNIYVVNSEQPALCENNLAITKIELVDLTSYSSSGYFAMKKMNNEWVNAEMSGYQMSACQ